MSPHRLPAVFIALVLEMSGITPSWSQAPPIRAAAPATSTSTTQSSQSITPITRRADPLLDLPPLPKTGVSLIGGTIARLDPIRDELVLHAFGGRDVKIQFDVRTQILRAEEPISVREL